MPSGRPLPGEFASYAAEDIAHVAADDAVAEAAAAERLPWDVLLADYAAVRQATLTFLRALPAGAWVQRGIVNGYEASVRGLAFHIAGHELRHLRAIEGLYWPRLNDVLR
jgi:hypothetical protein